MYATAIEPSRFTPTWDNHRTRNAIAIPGETLRRFGWREFIWSRSIYRNQFRELLDELRNDACVHTWAETLDESPDADDIVDAVLCRESERRPTEFVSYLGVRADGSLELVAVGSVAERIEHGFDFTGFPVIARCYTRRRFRGCGLYRHLLSQRVALCHAIWGEQLKAIHLGTANPRVMSRATSTDSNERFVQVGEEDLGNGAHQHRVAALFRFSSSFDRRLREEIDQWIRACGPLSGCAESAMVVRRQLHELIARGLCSGEYADLLKNIGKLRTRSGRDLVGECPSVKELFSFFDAIPLIQEQL